MKDDFDMICEIQARVAGLACPFCGQERLALVLRCDMHAEGCRSIARCKSCGWEDKIDRETIERLDRRKPAQERLPKMI